MSFICKKPFSLLGTRDQTNINLLLDYIHNLYQALAAARRKSFKEKKSGTKMLRGSSWRSESWSSTRRRYLWRA
jgi:hypothetical protein